MIKDTLLTDTIYNIVELVVQREKKPIVLENGELLYRFEIHVIDMIGKNEGINVVPLSEKMNVTKGAISQIIKKLAAKKFIVRERSVSNAKEIKLYLTEKGKRVYEHHILFHKEMNEKILSVIKDFSSENKQNIMIFLNQVIKILKE